MTTEAKRTLEEIVETLYVWGGNATADAVREMVEAAHALGVAEGRAKAAALARTEQRQTRSGPARDALIRLEHALRPPPPSNTEPPASPPEDTGRANTDPEEIMP